MSEPRSPSKTYDLRTRESRDNLQVEVGQDVEIVKGKTGIGRHGKIIEKTGRFRIVIQSGLLTLTTSVMNVRPYHCNKVRTKLRRPTSRVDRDDQKSSKPPKKAKTTMQDDDCDLNTTAKRIYPSGFGEAYLKSFEMQGDRPLPRVTLSRAVKVGKEALGDSEKR